MENLTQNIYFKKLTTKYRLKKVKFLINDKQLIQAELEFYRHPSYKFVKFLEIYLSIVRIKKTYSSRTLRNKIVIVFEDYTHRNKLFDILDILYNFMDYSTEIKIHYNKLEGLDINESKRNFI